MTAIDAEVRSRRDDFRLEPQSLPLTVIVGTRNESANIAKCLQVLEPAERVIVVDSASTDGTAEIAGGFNVEVVQFQYSGGYPKKRQWAMTHLDIVTPWTLLLDADEVVPMKLWNEIGEVIHSDRPAAGYLVRKDFHFLGQRFRFGGFSHQAVLLFQTGRARFEDLGDIDADGLDMEVHERLVVDGTILRLKMPVIHEDFKGLTAYLDRHNRYASWEAAVRNRFRKTGKWGRDSVSAKLLGNVQEQRRFLKQIACRIPGEPWLWFVYHFVVRLGFLEGRRGFIASRIRAQYIANVRAKMFEAKLSDR